MPDDNSTPRRRSLFSIPFRSSFSSHRSNSTASLPSNGSAANTKRNQKNALKLKKAVPTEKAITATLVQQKPFPVIDVSDVWQRDKQTGEITDHTDLLHSLVHRGSRESLSENHPLANATPAQPGSHFVSLLHPHLWRRIFDGLHPSDTASLALSSKAFRVLLGVDSWHALNQDHRQKIEFLTRLDQDLPQHLLCFSCATYHRRIQVGKENLQPTNIANPLYNCPNAFNPEKRPLRTRLTFGRTLPLTFVQLALRRHRYTPAHGIAVESLSRRYKDREGSWSHQTRYAVVNNHLLLRVISTCFVTGGLPPSGLRHLLYSREDFVPYFSVCVHWRDGELMPAVKCALGHIPKAPQGGGVVRLAQDVQRRLHPPKAIVTLCDMCRPMRRCPDCPSEYLIEVTIAEDRTDPVNLFKQALVVTRWSDLGDGRLPWSPEWIACNGEGDFDSFEALGRRAISGTFEAEYTAEAIPGQRIISMNPKNEKKGEAGHDWY